MSRATKTAPIVSASIISGQPETARGYTARQHADRALARAWVGVDWRPGHSQASCRETIVRLTGLEPTFSTDAHGHLRITLQTGCA